MDKLQLTYREIDILKQLAKGKTNNEIAVIINIREYTVKSHIQNIFNKMRVDNRTEAVIVAIKLGIINIKAG
jgi:DNA-binding NarL/FixJ family response regulator